MVNSFAIFASSRLRIPFPPAVVYSGMGNQRTVASFWLRVASLILILGGLAALAGCASALTPQTKSQISNIQNQSALDRATAAAAAKTRTARAEASPTSHPFAATNNTVGRWRKFLIPIAAAAFVLLGVFWGLSYTGLSWISKIGIPVSASVAAFAGLGAITLPFLFNPWIDAATVAAVIGVILYEIKRKGVAGAVAAVEAEMKSAANVAKL